MKRNLIKVIAILVAVLLPASMLTSAMARTDLADLTELQAAFRAAEDTSDLPDWQGNQLNLVSWNAHGAGGSARLIPEGNIVDPEITRVTGVTIDPNLSYDNGGVSAEEMLAKLVATGDYPAFAGALTADFVKRLADEGIIYDLTEYLPKYAPDLVANLPADKLPNFWEDTRVTGGYPGKVYGMPISYQPDWMQSLYPDQDLSKYVEPKTEYPFFYMRDDIVKMLYPEAKSQDEIDALYEKNGTFTREEIFDIPLKNAEDFYNLLQAIKDLGLMENGKPVDPFYVYSGGDNWALIAYFTSGLFGRNAGWRPDGNNFTFFNRLTQEVEYNYMQPEFKDEIYYINKLVRDGLGSKESLVDNGATFEQKRDSGQYATGYAWLRPNEETLANIGKEYRYRKVYIDKEPDTAKYTFTTDGASNGMGWNCIFKSVVSEEDLPQLLNYFNFFWTDAGKRVVYWGPRSAGMFTEENGVRQYVDPDLANEIVYSSVQNMGIDKGAYAKYGLGYVNGYLVVRPSVPNNLHPMFSYPSIATKEGGFKYFNPGYLDPYDSKLIPSISALITNFQGAGIAGIEKWSDSKTELEMSLTKVFGASDDDEFERLYANYIETAKSCGLDEETLVEINEYYKNVLNTKYMDNLK